MVLLPFLEKYKRSANFHDVMNSTSAVYSTNQIAQVVEYRVDNYLVVLEHRNVRGYIVVTCPSLCYTRLCVFLGPHPLM